MTKEDLKHITMIKKFGLESNMLDSITNMSTYKLFKEKILSSIELEHLIFRDNLTGNSILLSVLHHQSRR